jgi:hypothetical protein
VAVELGDAEPLGLALGDGHGLADALDAGEAVGELLVLADADALPLGVGVPLIVLFDGEGDGFALPDADGVGLREAVGVQGVDACTSSV